jgi:hypothetical protein
VRTLRRADDRAEIRRDLAEHLLQTLAKGDQSHSLFLWKHKPETIGFPLPIYLAKYLSKIQGNDES